MTPSLDESLNPARPASLGLLISGARLVAGQLGRSQAGREEQAATLASLPSLPPAELARLAGCEEPLPSQQAR